MLNSRLRRMLPSDSANDDGFAMLTVIGFGLVLSVIVALLAQYTIIGVKTGRRDQDFHAALTAAESGVDDYLARLNQNNVYWQSVDCANTAMKRPFTGGAPPCGWGGSTAVGWVPLPGSSDSKNNDCTGPALPPDCAVYHYDVDSSQTPVNGTISITATGKSRGVERSVREVLRRHGFADFLYYSDIEAVDPANVAVYGTSNATAQTLCSRHFWDNPTRPIGQSDGTYTYCSNITFIGRDTINGPLHTNDALLISGTPQFLGPVSTSYPACAPVGAVPPPQTSCYRDGGSAAPNFAKGITYLTKIDLPITNSALRAQVTPATAVGTPGCLYTGPTRIRFNSGGTMTVTSPYSLSVNPGCGTAPLTTAQTMPVPVNNVIIVQNVPSGQASPPNGNCATNAIDGRFPQAGDINVNYGEWNCRLGTAIVDGVLKGRLTLAADNNVLIVGNLTYANGTGGTDSLGLIANNSVEIYHPVNSSGTNLARNLPAPANTEFTDPVVNAAVLSLSHSYAVQLYSLGAPLGTLHLFGAISQKFRGAVGTFSGTTIQTGYAKDYNYDTRLRYAPPPFYLDPVSSSYARFTFGEVKAAY